jgi:3-hydroxybutyryl-CoA dehydrogenase
MKQSIRELGPHGTVAVIGGGTMGHGIAHVTARAGFSVRLFDPAPAALSAAFVRIRETLEKAVARGKLSRMEMERALGRIAATATLEEAASDADIVIEAVPERLDIKTNVFVSLDGCVPDRAMLATNTSSLSVTRIAAATRRPDRVIGLHFFNPVDRMLLLEVVRGRESSESTVAAGVDFARAIGKEPIVVKDSPGFATSRLGVVLGLEAIRMLEDGVASAAEIDRAMELGYNHPMGPLRLTDLVGLDVRLGIAEYLHQELGSDRYRPPELLREMVAGGLLGKKSGRGFYEWSGT